MEEEGGENLTEESGKAVPWQMFRHVIEQVRLFDRFEGK